MNKLVKILLLTLLGILALAVLLVLAMPLWLGPVAASVTRSLVPSYTGCEFKVERISLNPFTGKFRLVEAHLANPKGYDAPDAFSVGSVSVDLDVGSLLTDTVHVRDISIEKPYVSYVFDGEGSNNFARIAAAAQAKIGPSEEKPESEAKKADEKPGKKFRIDRLSINGTKVRYRMITLPIPVPTLTDIGKDSGGATAEEVRDSVWAKIKDSFSSIGAGLSSAAGMLGDGATNALKGAANLLGKDGAAGSATKALDKGAKAIGDGAKAVGDSAKGALKKVGDLLGK